MKKYNFPLEKELKSRLLEIAENLSTTYESYKPGGECLEEICYESYDGFIPYTNGGFRVMVPLDLMCLFSSGRRTGNESLDSQIEDYIQSSQEEAISEFISKHEETLVTLFPNRELKRVVGYHTLCEQGHEDLAEELSEIEYGYLSGHGSEFWLEIRVQYYLPDNCRSDDKTEPEILFMAGINFDFSYGRDCGLDAPLLVYALESDFINDNGSLNENFLNQILNQVEGVF